MFSFVLDFTFTSIGFFFFLSWDFMCILKISIGLRAKQGKNKEKSMDEKKRKAEKNKGK